MVSEIPHFVLFVIHVECPLGAEGLFAVYLFCGRAVMKKHGTFSVSLTTIGLLLCLGCSSEAANLVIDIPSDCDTPPDNKDCRCMDGTWTCPVKCPGECPDSCDLNGNCVDPNVKCPEECPETCNEDGICLNAVCPGECLNNCDKYGICIQTTVNDCPEDCLEDCDENGECIAMEYIDCPEECPDSCDEAGECIIVDAGDCPEDCAYSCDEDGTCIEPVVCPNECPDECNDEGECIEPVVCPDDCPDDCDEAGECIEPVVCPEDCAYSCDEDGECIEPVVCPEDCTDSCDEDGICPEEMTVIEALESVTGGAVKLAGKKIVVIGNSQLYKGWAVKPKQKTGGYLEKIISSYEGAGATVYNYTCPYCNIAKQETSSGCKSGNPCRHENGALGYFTGMKKKTDVDYVIASGPATRDKKIKTEMGKVKKVFPNARIVFLLQEFDYYQKKEGITNAKYYKNELSKYEIADWGKVARSFIGTNDYDRHHFILNDDRHPNLLSGFITAATAYSYLTNTSATRLKHDFFAKNYDDYVKNYNANKKFIKVMENNSKMTKIKNKIDEVNKINEEETCVHTFEHPSNVMLNATGNTDGVASAACSKCGKTLRVLYSTSKPATWNVMKIEPTAVTEAGKSTAEEYMKAGLGNVFRQTDDHTWGRQGYSSISNGGMASLCDGNRKKSSKNAPMSWTVKSTTEKYKADGTSDGEYISLIGYRFGNPVTVEAFAMFTANQAIASYDILGRVNGSWTVLYSGEAAYHDYTSDISYLSGTFDEWMTIDAVEIGVKTVSSKTLELVEFELYGLM